MSFEIAVGSNIRKSPYFEATVADGVKSFSVYNHMFAPAHFGDPEAQYRALLERVIMWDVACERQVELAGPDAEQLMRYLTPRDITGMAIGQGKYVPICNYAGDLINDPVVQKLADDCFWLSIADSDLLLWAGAIAAERGLNVRVSEPDASPLGVQGPRANDVVADLFGDWVRELKYFWFRQTELDGIPILLARSGWSKQGGFELYLRDASRGTELYNRVKQAGAPYGIVPGAPSDMERIESGLLSYGADARYGVNPFEVNLGAFMDLDRDDDFVGKAALQRIVAEGIRRRRVGFVIGGERISGTSEWHGVKLGDDVVGTVTEATFSPRLGQNIAVGMLAAGIADDAQQLKTDFGDGPRSAAVRSLPFC
ncbi:MAG: glycine cleavage T C-terminal barrel domain-containing protein [Xanthomonadales bacterium]|nr:glycine cleavage T C-terminal barrel domain-containing protein [Xanthomonadales bacterium]